MASKRFGIANWSMIGVILCITSAVLCCECDTTQMAQHVTSSSIRTKRGFAATDWIATAAGTQALEHSVSSCSWYYNWAPTSAAAARSGPEFVPMLWSAARINQPTLSSIQASGATTLLTFNEPDLASQANMSPTDAINAWSRLINLGLRLGSPAVSHTSLSPDDWLVTFMRQVAVKPDFITLHFYSDVWEVEQSVNNLHDYITQVHQYFLLPIWLTEFALLRTSASGIEAPDLAIQAKFAQGASQMLSSLPFVERFAWFGVGTFNYGTSLYKEDGSISLIGSSYLL